MRKRSYLIFGAIVVLGLVIVWRFFTKNAEADNTAESMPSAAVARVRRGSIENSLTLSGVFHPYQEIDVHAKVAGYIQKIYVDVGDQVKAGQVLAILEVPELSAEVVGAKADIARSEDAIRRAKSEIERAQSVYSANHSAYTRLKQASDARPGLIAEQELDDSLAKDKGTEAQVASAQAALSESESQLAGAHASLDRLSALEAYSHITAPFDGVITKRYADTGALIQAGTSSNTQSMPVVQLAEWSKLRLVVPVPESAVSQIRLGSAVQVHVSALGRDFQGRVARFADALNDETRTMHTEIDVENSNGTLKDGMYAEAKIVLSQQTSVLTVPVQAVERNGSGASVLIVDAQGRVQERQVKLGVESSDRVEAQAGVAENDQVIIGNRGEFRVGEIVRPRVMNEGVGAEGTN